MSIERKPSRLEQRLILTPIRAFLKRKFHITVERNDTLQMKPPYLILSNHVNNWDPLFINCFVNEPICFVAAAPLFRNPFLKRVLDYTGAISKTKFKNDTSTIRSMLKAKKHNRVIGIFPEGNRTWDGVTEPLVYSTSKLIKLLDIPVVIATIRGGYLTHPRWADGDRKGRISLSFVKLWNKGELAGETAETIHRKLTEALRYDEMEWQEDMQIPFRSKHPAHYLERLLFVCPHCKSPASLHSKGDLCRCGSCGYTVRYTFYGTFESVHRPLRFQTVHEWNQWQLAYVRQHFTHLMQTEAWQEAMKDPVKLYLSEDDRPFRLVGAGCLTWTEEGLHFESEGGKHAAEVPLDRIEGVNIHFHNKLDFFHDNRLYRFTFYKPNSSAFKWLTMIQTAQAAKAKNQARPEVTK